MVETLRDHGLQFAALLGGFAQAALGGHALLGCFHGGAFGLGAFARVPRLLGSTTLAALRLSLAAALPAVAASGLFGLGRQ